jgi:hypothetical protein
MLTCRRWMNSSSSSFGLCCKSTYTVVQPFKIHAWLRNKERPGDAAHTCQFTLDNDV